MKIFIFSTHIYWPNHRETELELIQNHLDQGDEVYRFYCNAHLPVCDVNLEHSLDICMECRDRRIVGNKLLDGHILEFPLINKSIGNETQLISIPEFHSAKELEQITIQNFDVGYAVLCSVCTILREPNPDFRVHKTLMDDFARSSIEVYFSTIDYIKRYKPDLIYVFNGRFAHTKAIWRASQYMGVNCIIHERGYNKDHYELFSNTTPHDKDYMLSCMIEAWSKADPELRNKKAEEFYRNRWGGQEQGWFSFITNQKRGALPSDWDESKRNIVIFHTSEDEFANVGPEWKNYLYETQIEGIKKILTDTQKNDDIHFYLRVHPNLTGINNTEMRAIKELHFDNLTVIEPDSPISSYDLLFNCEKVISFGSTMGIEAAYWEKPSIQLGHAYYNDLAVTYRPLTHKKAIDLIISKLSPLDKKGAMIYGYYFNTFGIPFKHYRPISLFDGLYRGKNIRTQQSFITKLYRRLQRMRFVNRIVKYLERDFRNNQRRIILPDWVR